MTTRFAAACFALTLVAGMPGAPAFAGRVERSFERSFPTAGVTTLHAVTNSGKVDLRIRSGSTVTVRGEIKRNVNWRGAQVTDAQIAQLCAAPPVRADGGTIRIERILDEALWRGVAIDFEVIVPATMKVVVETDSGAVSVAGSQSDVGVTTGSGATRIDAESGTVDVRSGSGSVRVAGTMEALSVRTQSGSIVAETASVGTVDVESGSGSIAVSGRLGRLRAETGSSQIRLVGTPAGDWEIRSRSGSVTIQLPADSRFDLSARSRSGGIKTAFAVKDRTTPTKHSVEGTVNGGGPRLDVETGSSSITLRS